MEAVVIHSQGDLRVEDHPDAAAPGRQEVQVNVLFGGICGSDLHYYNHGGFGAVRLREPMVLGHEVAGIVATVGDGVRNLAVGDKVAVNPSRPCNSCEYCLCDMRNQCLNMRFNGSAMRIPHEQGLFRAKVTMPATQMVKLRPGADLALAAMSEPLAVCLNAVTEAGSLVGKRVLVSGCGPTGCLTIVAALVAGADEIIATEIAEAPLTIAAALGADQIINIAQNAGDLAPLKRGKGRVDVVFECSGAALALQTAAEVIRPRGTIVTVGLGPDIPLPLGLVVTKEIVLKGSFRFDGTFGTAARLIDTGRVNVSPLLTRIFAVEDARLAFECANDKSRSMKVQLQFSGA